MASTSHRRCQYRGEGCMGTAHAGHDQCAWCYFTYIKPAIQAERQAMKGRRALKRQRLSAANRALISEVDLREPVSVPPSDSEQAIRHAIIDTEIDQSIQGLPEDLALERVGAELLRIDLQRTPALLPIPLPRPKPQEAETPDVTAVKPEERKLTEHTRTDRPPLSEQDRKDIADAYAAGISTTEIRQTWGVGVWTVYQIADQAGLPRRGRGGSTKKEEPEMPQSTQPVSAPVVATPSANGAASALPTWTVVYYVRRQETRVVHARSFNDAAAMVESEGGTEVLSVSRETGGM